MMTEEAKKKLIEQIADERKHPKLPRRQFTDDLRRKIIAYADEFGLQKVTEDLDVSFGLVHVWRKKLEEKDLTESLEENLRRRNLQEKALNESSEEKKEPQEEIEEETQDETQEEVQEEITVGKVLIDITLPNGINVRIYE